MSAPATLAAFALVLVAVFAAALGLGRVVGPVGTAAGPAESVTHSTDAPGHEEDR